MLLDPQPNLAPAVQPRRYHRVFVRGAGVRPAEPRQVGQHYAGVRLFRVEDARI